MNDREFAELQLRASICPGQCEWPRPEYVHWQKLHEAANEARQRVNKFYMLADEIDRDADLSAEGKYRQRSKSGALAIADFEGSKTLAHARQAIELAMAKRNFEQDVSPEISQDREAMLKASKEVERGWQRGMEKIAERANLTKGPDTRRSLLLHSSEGYWLWRRGQGY
jgi:hypothetical protein